MELVSRLLFYNNFKTLRDEGVKQIMKTVITRLSVLCVSVLFFYNTYSNAQNVQQVAKSRPADFEYLSAPDSLGIRHPLKMPNLANRNAVSGQRKLPYPIIFIHGLDSDSDSCWNDMTDFLDVNYLFTFGGRMDYCLNYDSSHVNKLFYPSQYADIAIYSSMTLIPGDYYYVNFAVGHDGSFDPLYLSSQNVLSNQSAIAKQGMALQQAIIAVRNLTGSDKVILMGHSMGGLAAREYLQNPSNWVEPNFRHHVAKLVTTGTPHGGSNASLGIFGTIYNGTDYQSEAMRDLKKSYSSGSEGVFLFGGDENNTSIYNGYNYYNIDVNCNGTIGENITGLNQKSWYGNIDYACIIGNALTMGGVNGDGAVTVDSANLNNNYPNITQNLFYVDVIHTTLPSQIYKNMQGLDEPNDYNLAYEVGFNKDYYGFITEQSPSSIYVTDWDDYKFTVANNSQVNIDLGNSLLTDISVQIVGLDYNLIGTIHTCNSESLISFSQTLPAGQYYLEISGTPTSTSYQSPYFFNLSSTLSTNNFTTDKSLNVFPSPTTSKVFFDNSKFNFEKVSICNILGQEVSKVDFTYFTNNQQVDLSKFSKGTYILKLSNQEVTKTVKIIKN